MPQPRRRGTVAENTPPTQVGNRQVIGTRKIPLVIMATGEMRNARLAYAYTPKLRPKWNLHLLSAFAYGHVRVSPWLQFS